MSDVYFNIVLIHIFVSNKNEYYRVDHLPLVFVPWSPVDEVVVPITYVSQGWASSGPWKGLIT